MRIPFDNPEIAAASRKRGEGGRVTNGTRPAGNLASPCNAPCLTVPGRFRMRRPRGAPAPRGRADRPAAPFRQHPLPIPRAGCSAGNAGLADQEVYMFEGQPQTELDAMMKANSEFRQLYFRHRELDKQVLDAELGVLPIDDTTLGQMKREKLAAKQRLLQMYERAN